METTTNERLNDNHEWRAVDNADGVPVHPNALRRLHRLHSRLEFAQELVQQTNAQFQEALLGIFEDHGVRATFFVLGWVAERQPELIRTIAAAGHEIASHGWDHVRVTHQTPAQFRDSIRRTKSLLEAITGQPVLGFRAPSFSIVAGREWALDVLIEEGYRYDSSLFPVRRPGGGYGYPNGSADPHWLERPAGRLAEIPPTTLRWCGVRLPAAGGAYFRLLPYNLVRATINALENGSAPADIAAKRGMTVEQLLGA